MQQQNQISKSDPDLHLLCKYAFDILSSSLDKSKSKAITPTFPEKFKNLEFPLFVTWTTGSEKRLRGCIGTFASANLEENLEKYSWIAALHDSRFPPIQQQELPSLNCGISLLTNFETAKDAYDWEIGKNGIQIDFETDRNYRATFLPEVASEQGWDKETTLKHWIAKSGFYGKWPDVVDKLKTTRYESIKISMTYREYSQ